MKFAICQEIFQGWELERIIRFCSRIGYDGLELAPFTLADRVTDIALDERLRIKSLAEDAGLEIAGLHWLLVKPDGMYINHADESVRRATVNYLKDLADFCKDVGGKVMTLGSPKQRDILPQLTHSDAWDLAKGALAEVGERCGELGVVLCIEPLPAAQTNFINTAAEAVALAADIGNPGVAMMLDVKSMCAEEPKPIPEIIRECAGRFRHVHANDKNLKGPGFGDVDFVPVFETLMEAGYDGYVSVEAFDYAPDPETVAIGSLRYMKMCAEKAGCR